MTLPLPPTIVVDGRRRKDLLREVIESSRANDASTTKQCICLKNKHKVIIVSINSTDDSPWLPDLKLSIADKDILLSMAERPSH